ncbi:MAG: PAS domain-containing protein [Stenotrophomonas sp.]|uniref:PAS domain-containing protein n=1 Tax=Stenotrophomonas sp. TaxID=69392 RepID=UPI003D6D782E
MSVKPRLEDLLEPLYASVLDLSALDTFNQRLADATDSPITGVLIHDVAAGKGQVSHIHGVDNAHMASLLAELDLRDDPWMKRVTPQLAIGRVLDTEDMLPRREALRSGFYNAYYRQLGIVQQVAAVGLYDGVSSVTLSLCHGDIKRAYGEAELGLLRALTPHWINAYAMLRRIGGLQQQVSTLEQALEHSPVAMFMLNAALHICRTNAAAESLLGSGLLRRDAGALAVNGRAHASLQALLQRALRGASLLVGGDVEKLVLHDANDRPALVMTAHRLPAAAMQESGELLVFAREVNQAPVSQEPTLQRLFGLTAAEARLALALYRHADVAAAARECGITPGTALGRLKTIYDKTGEHGQVSLVRLIAAVITASSG